MPHRFEYTTPSGHRIVERQPSRMYRLELQSTDAVLRNASVIAHRDDNKEARRLIQQARKALKEAVSIDIKGADQQTIELAGSKLVTLHRLLRDARRAGAPGRHIDSALHSSDTAFRALGHEQLKSFPSDLDMDISVIEKELA